jgi:hypothetical protein
MNALLVAELRRLERRLKGPRRLRTDMIAEVRDGLLDAAAAHREAGLDHAAAAHRALEELGDVELLARELQHEVTARQARRAALVVGLAFLPLVLAWDLVWRLAPHSGPPPADGLTVVYTAIDLVQVAAGLAGGALALALRRPGTHRRLCRAAGVLGVATPAVIGALAVLMLTYGPWAAGPALATPVTALLSVASASALIASAVVGARCLRLTPGPPPAPSGR